VSKKSSNKPSVARAAKTALPFAADGTFRRVIRLRPEEWLLPAWRRQETLPQPPVSEFDRRACMGRLNQIADGDHINDIRPAEPPLRMRKCEAWFWMNAVGSLKDLRSIEEISEPSPEEVRTRFKGNVYPGWSAATVTALQAFFTPAELLDLILQAPSNRWWGSSTSKLLQGYACYISPYLTPEERRLIAQPHLSEVLAAPSLPVSNVSLEVLVALGMTEAVEQALGKVIPDPNRGVPMTLCLGTGSESAFVAAVRRFSIIPSTTVHLRWWLSATEHRQLDALEPCMATAFRNGRSSAARELFEVVALAEVPELAPLMLRWKRVPAVARLAAQWLVKHPVHAAVGLAGLAAGNDLIAAEAREHLQALAGDHGPLIASAAEAAEPTTADLLRNLLAPLDAKAESASAETMPDEIAASLKHIKARRMPSWISLAMLPAIRLAQPASAMADAGSVVSALMQSELGRPADLVQQLKQLAEPESLAGFASAVFRQWLKQSCPAGEWWVLWAVAWFGGQELHVHLAQQLLSWPHQRAVAGIEALVAAGSRAALTRIYALSRWGFMEGMRSKAAEEWQRLAQSAGVTEDQLADMQVYDGGLDEQGRRFFINGDSVIIGTLDEHLRPRMIRGGKSSPARPDTSLPELRKAWKPFRRLVQDAVNLTVRRLQQDMLDETPRLLSDFRRGVLGNPLFLRIASQIVWTATDANGAVEAIFRPAEDGELIDVAHSRIALPDNATVMAVHPLRLTAGQKSQWQEHFEDHRIVQPFPQVHREVVDCLPDERNARTITRFEDQQVPHERHRVLTDAALWRCGSVNDVNQIRHFHRAGVIACICHDAALYFGTAAADRTIRLGEIYFVKEDLPVKSWRAAKNHVLIGEVPPIILSETLRLAHLLSSIPADAVTCS
jgi:hypothetical protein